MGGAACCARRGGDRGGEGNEEGGARGERDHRDQRGEEETEVVEEAQELLAAAEKKSQATAKGRETLARKKVHSFSPTDFPSSRAHGARS